jgi:hypothetical protein
MHATTTDPLVNMLVDLATAAATYGKRGQGSKKLTCLDMAAKLGRYRTFASDKQRDYALALIAGAKDTPPAAAPVALHVPALHEVLQRHTKFYADRLVITRRNGDQLCWLLWDDTCVGKIDNGTVTIFVTRLPHRADVANIEGLLREFDADPLAAAIKYGKLSGRCCSCGRELTHEDSLAAGIGPVCRKRLTLEVAAQV